MANEETNHPRDKQPFNFFHRRSDTFASLDARLQNGIPSGCSSSSCSSSSLLVHASFFLRCALAAVPSSRRDLSPRSDSRRRPLFAIPSFSPDASFAVSVRTVLSHLHMLLQFFLPPCASAYSHTPGPPHLSPRSKLAVAHSSPFFLSHRCFLRRNVCTVLSHLHMLLHVFLPPCASAYSIC